MESVVKLLKMVHREEGRSAQALQTVWQPPKQPAMKAAPKVDTVAQARKARDYILQYAVEDSESDGEGSQVYITKLSF